MHATAIAAVRLIGPLVVLGAALAWLPQAVAGDDGVAALTATARRAGLRVLEGERLVLVTDRPPRHGDGVEELPRIFAEAFASWCAHYGIDPGTLPDWQAFGCLIVDRETFRAAGLLPAHVPEFANGFCERSRFWMADQSNPDYRRHLLLHEGVHAFTLTVRRLDAPEWYKEGIAEYLATHRLEADAAGVERFVAAPLPARRTDVEQLGRIEHLRRLEDAGAPPDLAAVLAAPVGNHDIAAYAAGWAAVALFAGHPAYAGAFAAAERGPLDADFTARLAATPGWDASRAARDYAAFLAELDYGYDFARSAIDWSPGRLLTGPRRGAVDATRGWQNSGFALRRGDRYRVVADGRFRIGEVAAGAPAGSTPLESEADGISLRWYRGRPIGRLLAAQWIEPAAGKPPAFVILGTGREAAFTAAGNGPLFLRINESPGELGDNRGALAVEIGPAAD